MKIHTMGTFDFDGQTLVGVVLVGTTAEVREVAQLYSTGVDRFKVARKPDDEPAKKETTP